MGLLSWIILGGLAGWVASIVAGTNARMGVLANVGVGIAGAVVGGMIFNAFGGVGISGFSLHSFGVAFIGAVVILAVARIVFRL